MFGRIIQTSILLIFIILSQSLAQDSLTFDLNFTQKKLPFGLTEKVQADLPKVGLALSGGGARGFAQIGVLRAFVENDIPISSITGTSMGSIIGALYVSGYSFDEIDSILINSDWQSLFSSNEASRKELYVEDKITEDRALVTLRLNGLKPILPNSILTGQKVENFLNILAINAPINFYTDFNDFLIPYQAITSDLISGDAVVFKKGSLAQTLRASSSVTLLLPPVKVDSMLLVDGGLVANIPTEYVKKDGADIVIAVNTTSSLRSESELNVPFNYADQILSVPMRKLNEQQLSLADVIISPIIDSLSNNDFRDSNLLIKEGFLSGKKSLSSIRSLIENHLKNVGNKIAIRGSLFPKGINYKTEKDLINALSHYKIINKAILQYELSKIIDVNSFSSIQIQLNYTSNITELGIKLNENHFVNYLEIKGESLLDEKTIKQCSDNLVGKPYNQKELMKTVLNILRKYRKKGYSLAVVKDIKFDELGNLTITIDEGSIDKIELVGNEKTRDDVILREFPLNENQLFNIYDAKKGLDGLRSIKLFESSELVLNEKNGKKIVSINVKEKPSNLVRFGLRVDNENFTQASIDIRDENLFGSGTDLGLIISGGIRNGKFSIEHKANRIFNTYFTYKLRAFYDYQDVITYRTISSSNIHKETREKVGEYNQSFLGVSIGLGTQVQKFGNIIFEGKYHINEVKELSNFTGSVFRTPIFSFKFGFIIDSKDKYPYPNSGTLLKAYYETAQKIMGGEIAYSKMDIQYQSYFAIDNSNNISPKVVFGFADETLPLSQHFSMGGQYSFFGMRDFERRGRQIFVTSLEYRYLLPIKLFFDSYFKFRYDLGSVWESREQIRLKDLRHGFGLSLSIDTPIGPAEFSAGKTFRISEQNLDYRFISSPWNFYFRIGYYY